MNSKESSVRSVQLPFGDWFYFPRQSLNLVALSPRPMVSWKPIHISIAITARCEKKCDFCYAESGPEGTTCWKLKDILQLVESCDRNGVFTVTLGGGEPLLWSDPSIKANFYDLLNELRVFGCDISFTTSAVPSINWSAVPSTILPRLSLSHFQELAFITEEIKRACAQWGNIPAVNLLVRKGNVSKLLAVAETLAKIGVRDFLLLPLRPVGRSLGSSLIPTEEELRQLIQSFPIPQVKLSSCCHLENQKDTFLGCGAGDWFVSLDEKRLIKACSFNKNGKPLLSLEYQEICKVLSSLDRLPCHTRIRLL